MKNTLIVSYTPRQDSYTKVLVDEFLALANHKTNITFLDLVATPPDLLLADNLNLILSGNPSEFTPNERERLRQNDLFIDQVLAADYIVIASPMYNFSLPATVKAWVDSIVASDKTFTFSENNGFKGLCKNTEALVLMVSGNTYSDAASKEYFSPLIKTNFEFVGIPSKQISASGVNQFPEQVSAIISKAKNEIKTVIQAWY